MITGTVMERSHIALNKWLMAFYLMSASKKGISAHQLHRALAVDYKSAWFMCHRIRLAMEDGSLTGSGPLGGEGKIVEADETYYGPTEKPKKLLKPRTTPYTKGCHPGPANKRAIVALVERGGSPLVPCRSRRQGDGQQDRHGQHRQRKPLAHR